MKRLWLVGTVLAGTPYIIAFVTVTLLVLALRQFLPYDHREKVLPWLSHLCALITISFTFIIAHLVRQNPSHWIPSILVGSIVMLLVRIAQGQDRPRSIGAAASTQSL